MRASTAAAAAVHPPCAIGPAVLRRVLPLPPLLSSRRALAAAARIMTASGPPSRRAAVACPFRLVVAPCPCCSCRLQLLLRPAGRQHTHLGKPYGLAPPTSRLPTPYTPRPPRVRMGSSTDLLHVAHDGTLGHVTQGLHVANRQSRLPAAVDELWVAGQSRGARSGEQGRAARGNPRCRPSRVTASSPGFGSPPRRVRSAPSHLAGVDALSGNEQLLLVLVADRVTESHLHRPAKHPIMVSPS